MSTLLATSRSGNDWKQADLLKYSIRVIDLPFQTFFSPLSLSSLPPLPHALESFASTPDHTRASDDATYRWLHYLHLAQREPEQVAVDIFADRLLHLLGYDQGRRLALTRHPIPSIFCGIQYNLITDVCICDENGIILLLIKDDKVGLDTREVHASVGSGATNGSGEAEPTLIASAVAAFGKNNETRVKRLNLPPLEEMTFPGVTFTGTFPTFYRIRVTANLNQAMETGTCVGSTTEVYRHIPQVPGPQDQGMEHVGNRHILLRYFIAFKRYLL